MLTEERKKYILDSLALHGIVKNVDLIQQLHSSQTTIRRDLQELEDEGLLQRIHGGAQQISSLKQEDSMSVKSTKNVQEKQMIGQTAAKQVTPYETIFLDAGTSTYAMIPFLQGKPIQVITNSIYHANQLVDLDIPTTMLGGRIKQTTKAAVGMSVYQQVERMQFDKCFIGTNGIHLEAGFTTPDQEEATLKQLVIQQSQQAYLLADHTKFDQIFFATFATIEETNYLITDHCPKTYQKTFKHYHIMEVKS